MWRGPTKRRRWGGASTACALASLVTKMSLLLWNLGVTVRNCYRRTGVTAAVGYALLDERAQESWRTWTPAAGHRCHLNAVVPTSWPVAYVCLLKHTRKAVQVIPIKATPRRAGTENLSLNKQKGHTHSGVIPTACKGNNGYCVLC